MIGVIGATGNVGSALVRMLSNAGESVVAVTRRGGADTPRVRHVAADLARPAQLRDALRGTHAVFVMIPGAGEGIDPQAIVGAATASGTRRIVLLSSIGSRSRPTAVSHEPLRQLEAAVKQSGLGWTILQPGGFASNAMGWLPSVRAQRMAASPFGDVGIPIVDPEDIAAVAAAALRDERHAGATYVLTGPEPITPRAQVAALAAAIESPITFVELTRAQALEAWSAFMPKAVVETTLDALGTPNDLERHVSGDIARVLGRDAQPFAAWAARHADVFR